MAWANTAFYLIFAGQIILLSHYFPRRMLARMRFVCEHYPPTTHPKLYTRSIDIYRLGQRIYSIANQVILVLGFILLFLIIRVVDHSEFADDGYISEAWPIAFAMLQFIPYLALEVSGITQFRQMREANQRSTRSAVLRPRRFFDYISPKLFIAAAALLLGTILIDVGVDGFALTWKVWNGPVGLVGTVLFFALIGRWVLHGKQDPHQSATDRERMVGAQLHAMVFCTILISLFYGFNVLDQIFGLDYLDAVMMSLYLQGCAVLSIGHLMRSVRLEDINFDVYRDDARTA